MMSFELQKLIAKPIVKNLIAKGALPISIVEKSWFRTFCKDAIPMFTIQIDERFEKIRRNEKRIIS